MNAHYKVNIVDAPCGIGKTSSAINMINNDDTGSKYMYITPFLQEVQRIKNSCPNKNFKEPDLYKGKKINDVKNLIQKGENIVTTHALFSSFDAETIQLAYLNNYILIMDEVADVVDTINITPSDINNILEKHAKVEEDGKLVWLDKDYTGKYEEYKHLCEIESLYIYGETGNKAVVLWNFPVSVFKAFQQIYILTYMFDAQSQRYYFDMHNVEYEYLYVMNQPPIKYTFTTTKQDYPTKQYSELINICDHKKLNLIGDLDFSLTKTWYTRFKDNKQVIKAIKNNMENYTRNIVKASSEDIMWTTFKSFTDLIKGKGYTKSFVACNARATNDYANRTSVMYMINLYINPVIKNFFIGHGVDVQEDRYAMSEMIQFIFRSAIRNNQPINIYVPSLRMRNLLHQWLEEDKERSIIDLSIENQRKWKKVEEKIFQ
jgi:hypothetical protein